MSRKPSPQSDKIKDDILRFAHKLPVDSSIDEDMYCQCVPASTAQIKAGADTVYNDIIALSERDESRNGLSSFAFSLATILALCLHREHSSQHFLERNETTPYFDLSPLYGTCATETEKIRRKDGSGMLQPDCFSEGRIVALADSVAVLLILWNRYHNYAAKQLLMRNERKRWHNISELPEEQRSAQDEEIFNVARSITCIHLMNVIKEDFMKCLSGAPFVGESLDLNFSSNGQNDHVGHGHRSTRESYFLYSVFLPFSSDVSDQLMTKEHPSCIGHVRRNGDGFFDNSELADVLFKATEQVYSGPRFKNIPHPMIRNIMEARKWKICSLNEFRVHLGLKALDSFESWNKTLAPAARKLYQDDISHLELYPGLLGEGWMNDSGLNFGETLTSGLIADIASRLRSDPRFTTNYHAEALTAWGYNDCTQPTGGCFKTMLPKLLQRTIPTHCPYDNVYSLFPLCTPKESRDRLKEYFKDSDVNNYYFRRPSCGKVKVLGTLNAIKTAFNDPANFASPYKENLMRLTGGYGHFLGFDDLELHDGDLMLTLFSLLPDKGAAKRIGDTFARMARENVENRCMKSVDGKRATIDLVGDVIEATCTRWVCEVMCMMDLGDENMRGMTKKQQDVASKRAYEMENKAHEDFDAFYTYIHNNTEQEMGWRIRERALGASRHLSEHLTQQLGKAKTQGVKEQGTSLIRRLLLELLYGRNISMRRSADPFLYRFMKSVKLNELPNKLVDRIPHLQKLKKKYLRSGQDRDEEEDKAKMAVEDHRAIALIIGLVVEASVNLSKVCAQVVDFYLNDDKYETERKKIVQLCKDETTGNEDIMGYIREAQRIAHRFGIWRDVASEANIEIEQGGGHPSVTIEPGDQVFADFASAHNNPSDFQEPHKVKPDRHINSLYGLGIHKCPALPLIEEILPQLFRVIFSLGDLTPSVDNGRLTSATLRPDPAPWDPQVFLDKAGGVSYCPGRMIVEFDSADLQNNIQKRVWGKIAERRERKMKDDLKRNERYGFYFVLVLLGLLVIKVIAMARNPPWHVLLSPYQSPPQAFPSPSPASEKSYRESSLLSPSPVPAMESTEQLVPSSSLVPEMTPGTITCVNPTPVISWSITQFVPQIGSPQAGEPASLILYETKGNNVHQISFVDLDARDIMVDAWIDDRSVGHREVDLDSTLNCGSDIGTCIAQGFSSAYFTVPPGEHIIKATIFKQIEMEPFDWAGDTKKRIGFTVEECRP